MTQSIEVLDLHGSFYDMGYQHGVAKAEEIREITQERLQLSGTLDWSGREISVEEALELGEASLQFHQDYDPDLYEEIRGMADATGLSEAELVIMNGFTDFVDTVYAHGGNRKTAPPKHFVADCTVFGVPKNRTTTGQAYIGQTWDMHASAADHVILLRGKPTGKPAFLAFTTSGVIGLIGMNDAGIAVAINNLSDGSGRIGVTYTFVVRKVLMQTNLEDALRRVTEAPLGGGHNYMLMDKDGNGYNVEAMAASYHITPLETDSLVHTNHCLHPQNDYYAREVYAPLQEGSYRRLARGEKLLSNGAVSLEDLMNLTRDKESICVPWKNDFEGQTCGAVVMSPSTGEFWAVQGLPTENPYNRYSL